MIDIKFKINGRSVTPNRLADEFEKTLFQQVTNQMKSKLGSLRCAVHGKTPVVTVKGRSLDKASVSVTGCCDDLIQKATKKL